MRAHLRHLLELVLQAPAAGIDQVAHRGLGAGAVGLGGAERVERLTVHWPDGTKDSFENLPADQRLRIVQGAGFSVVEARTQAALAALPSTALEPIEGPADRTVLAASLPMAAVRVPSVAAPD